MAELERRLIHASGTTAPASYLLGIVTWDQLGWLLLAGCLLAFVMEAIRLGIGLDWRLYDRLTRDYEQDNVAGYALYGASMTTLALVFPPVIAVPAMLMLTVGDPVGGYLGEGRRTKSPVALGGVFAVCVVLAVPFVSLATAVLGALVATIADGYLLSIRGYFIDDNLTIPLGSALAMWLGSGVSVPI